MYYPHYRSTRRCVSCKYIPTVIFRVSNYLYPIRDPSRSKGQETYLISCNAYSVDVSWLLFFLVCASSRYPREFASEPVLERLLEESPSGASRTGRSLGSISTGSVVVVYRHSQCLIRQHKVTPSHVVGTKKQTRNGRKPAFKRISSTSGN